MTEHPILFSGQMVKAILDGTKTQTRRVVKPQPEGYDRIRAENGGVYGESRGVSDWFKCPYGKVGDKLWVRETWAINDVKYEHPIPKERPSDLEELIYRADGELHEQFEIVDGDLPWKPSIHMPRWASRINLEIVKVRVERLQDISNEDTEAEGMDAWCDDGVHDPGDAQRTQYKELWNKLNEKRGYGWDKNPWVWVVEFKKLEGKS